MVQLKHLPEHSVVATKLKLFWDRITFSRITIFYFIFSVVHCFVQVVFQVQAFMINADAADFLTKIIHQGNASDPGFSVMAEGSLRFCNVVPKSMSIASCQLIWGGVQPNASLAAQSVGSSPAAPFGMYSVSTSSSVPVVSATTTVPVVSTKAVIAPTVVSTVFSATATVTKIKLSPTVPSAPSAALAALNRVVADRGDDDDDDDDKRKTKRAISAPLGQITAVKVNGTTEVTIDGLGWNNTRVRLDQRCILALNWPVEILDNTKREDITFISFQFWVLGMSIVAILNESMPHIIASLLTHILATGWGGFQIAHTERFRRNFIALTTQGACKPINLLPSYWKQRGEAEIPSLALNALALLVSAFLSWRLIKLFGWQTFKRVGASRTINRVYMLVLSLSIAIQLSLFFIVVTIALWIDQLYNGSIARLAKRPQVYKATLIVVLLLLLPWLTLGWVAVRRELRLPMLLFLAMSAGYLAGWGGMFASDTFRWTFIEWRFYSLMASASVLLTLSSLLIGIMCRVNFGKGLPRYLSAQEPLPEDDFEPQNRGSDAEKVDFPSMSGPIPTFSAAFGKGDEVPVPSLMFNARAPRLGPRFTNPSIEPFEPQPGHTTGSGSDVSSFSNGSTRVVGGVQLSRQDSGSSQHSYSSFESYDSRGTHKTKGSDGPSQGSRSKRWVIE